MQADQQQAESSEETLDDIHPIQQLMDNPWLLLAIGLLVPFLSYTLWGWIELLMIENAQLP